MSCSQYTFAAKALWSRWLPPFCNGTTTFCDGLSQWGSENLAQQGYNSIQILRHYYGDNVELVTNATMQDIQYSYPGAPMRLGDVSPEIRVAQIMLNRISASYPAIPWSGRWTDFRPRHRRRRAGVPAHL